MITLKQLECLVNKINKTLGQPQIEDLTNGPFYPIGHYFLHGSGGHWKLMRYTTARGSSVDITRPGNKREQYDSLYGFLQGVRAGAAYLEDLNWHRRIVADIVLTDARENLINGEGKLSDRVSKFYNKLSNLAAENEPAATIEKPKKRRVYRCN